MEDQRFECELDADGYRSVRFEVAASARDAAQNASKAWRSDCKVEDATRSGTDLYGGYERFTLRAGLRFASVRVANK